MGPSILRLALSLRFVMLVASVGAGVGAALMFWVGGVEMVSAASKLVAGGEREAVITAIMHGIDAFLFGIVLVIFAYAITFGFVFDPSLSGWQSLPAWMRISNISELKNTLVEVILLYLLVDLATDWAELEGEPSWTILAQPLSMLAIAAAFGIFTALHGRTGGHASALGDAEASERGDKGRP